MMSTMDPGEQALRQRLAAPLGALPRSAGADHVEPDLLVAHAANELPPDQALFVTRHLAFCTDGRCPALLAEAVAGMSAARDALYDHPYEEPAEVVAAEAASPTPESAPDRESAHTFECRDALWAIFEALARTEGCPPERLIGEAMKAYVQQRPRAAGPSAPVAPRDVTFTDAPVRPGGAPFDPPRERNTPTLQRTYLPKAPPSSRRTPTHALEGRGAHKLRVVLEGQAYEVTKERFVVGRGGRASDLSIDDPGVSRQHALIEQVGGAYYLVDMGSTNGVELGGERIARKEIAHGDRFVICDHELEFLLD